MLPDAAVADLILELTESAVTEAADGPRATARATLTCEASGSERLTSPSFDLVAPLGPIEREELGWYLERYYLWPTNVFRQRARQVESNLEIWGRWIYEALLVDGTREVFAAWRATEAARRFTVQVDG